MHPEGGHLRSQSPAWCPAPHSPTPDTGENSAARTPPGPGREGRQEVHGGLCWLEGLRAVSGEGGGKLGWLCLALALGPPLLAKGGPVPSGEEGVCLGGPTSTRPSQALGVSGRSCALTWSQLSWDSGATTLAGLGGGPTVGRRPPPREALSPAQCKASAG